MCGLCRDCLTICTYIANSYNFLHNHTKTKWPFPYNIVADHSAILLMSTVLHENVANRRNKNEHGEREGQKGEEEEEERKNYKANSCHGQT